MLSSINSITHTASQQIAEIIECAIIDAIRDKYDGYLYYITRIGWENGAVKIDVIVTRDYPEEIINEHEIVSCVDVSEAMRNLRGMA